MPDQSDLESLYRDAQSALKARDYAQAANLLKQILVKDENYKDASRLLARIVKIGRRRWYNDLRICVPIIGIVVIGLLIWSVPKLSLSSMFSPTSTPTVTTSPTITLTPTRTANPTITPSPTPTPIPFAWKRVSVGLQFPRDDVTAIVFDPLDPDVIYIGTMQAGIYKSINGGLSWVPVQNNLGRASIDSLIIDAGSNTLYAGTYTGGVYKSEDDGYTWQDISSGLNGSPSGFIVGDVQMDAGDDQHLYFTDGGGFYNTQDGGKTWNRGSQDCVNWFGGLVSHPTEAGTLLANEFFGFKEGCPIGLYLSRNGGAEWNRLEGVGDSRQIGFDGGGSGYLYVTEQHNHAITLFGSPDLGTTWETLFIDNTTDQFLFAVAPGQPGWIYLLNQDSGTLRRSRDFGATWEMAATSIVTSANTMAVSPHDPEILWLGAKGLYLSPDGGQAWEERSSGLGGSGLILKDNPYHAGDLYLEHGMGDWGCALFHSQDGGVSWQDVSSLKETCRIEFASGGGRLYSTTVTGDVLTSTDAGTTWTPMFQLPLDELNFSWGNFPQLLPHPRDGNIFFAYAGRGGFGISGDSGKTWNVVESSSNIWPYGGGVNTLDGQRLYAAGDPGGVIYSTDGGQNWLACSYPNSSVSRGYQQVLSIDPDDVDHLLIATGGGGIQFSTDGCHSWQPAAMDVPSRFINCVTFDPGNPKVAYAGADAGAYLSFDGGTTWNLVNDGLLGATVIYSIVVDKDGNVFAATPYGIFRLEGK